MEKLSTVSTSIWCKRLDRSALLRTPIKLSLLCILKRRHLEVVWQLKLCVRIALEGNEINKQTVLDGKHGIVFNILAAAVEDLCDDRLVAGGCELFQIST